MSNHIDQIVFEKGVEIIRCEIEARLAQFAIADADIQRQTVGPLGPVTFLVRVGDKVEKSDFTIEEIQDSAKAIDHPASLKVGHLVSHFVR